MPSKLVLAVEAVIMSVAAQPPSSDSPEINQFRSFKRSNITLAELPDRGIRAAIDPPVTFDDVAAIVHIPLYRKTR
jgi:hypothetical protein